MSNIEFNRRDLIIRLNPILGFKCNAKCDVIIGGSAFFFICRLSLKTTDLLRNRDKRPGAYGELGLKLESRRLSRIEILGEVKIRKSVFLK